MLYPLRYLTNSIFQRGIRVALYYVYFLMHSRGTLDLMILDGQILSICKYSLMKTSPPSHIAVRV